MKTTIEIGDDLFRRAKETAAAEGITLRDLIESGLRAALDQRESRAYRMPDRSVPGNGVQPGIAEGDWDLIRGLVYEDRGG